MLKVKKNQRTQKPQIVSSGVFPFTTGSSLIEFIRNISTQFVLPDKATQDMFLPVSIYIVLLIVVLRNCCASFNASIVFDTPSDTSNMLNIKYYV